jgi:hypothetical protein
LAKLWHDRLDIVDHDLLRASFKEVGKSGASVSLNSWNGIIQHLSKGRKHALMESLLEIFSHVVCHLSNTVDSSIADLRVRVLEMLNNNRNHGSNLVNVIKILTNLRQSHKASILVSPIVIVSEGSLNESAEQWQHDLITDAGYESIDACLSKVNRVLILLFFISLETFLGAHP